MMKTSTIGFLTLALFWGVASVPAQLVSDGTTAVRSAVPASIAGTLTVGTNASNTVLIITNTATVTNINGVIGQNTAATAGRVIVSGPGSHWVNSGSLFVGSNGLGNVLMLTNGGRASAASAFIGTQAGATNNQVILNGIGSALAVGTDANVGYFGANNRLSILNGATMANDSGILGAASNANFNSVTVAGANATWTNRFELFVGNGGSGNSLFVTNSGRVFVGGSVHFGANSSSANNSALVAGTNSFVSAASDLYLGENGGGNSLMISNAAAFTNGTTLAGLAAGANNNRVTVTGTNSVWQNHGDLLFGFASSGNSLVVSAGGTVNSANGSIGSVSGANNNQALVTGPGSAWRNAGSLVVGDAGAGNSLMISNGGQVENAGALIGQSAGGNNNRLTVAGAGSVWNNLGSLQVGVHGANNALVINSGGVVSNAPAAIGSSFGGNGNVVHVGGTGSLWRVGGDLVVGGSGVGNSLAVSNGGRVDVATVYFGQAVSGVSNRATVTGPGSQWNIASDLRLGVLGGTNSLLVANGAVVTNMGAFIGDIVNSRRNQADVTGANSQWRVGGDLVLGVNGAANIVTVSNGARLDTVSSIIGQGSFSDANRVTISGAGSVWNSGGNAVLGLFGPRNIMEVLNGGAFNGTNLTVGGSFLSTDNQLTVGGGTLTTTNAAQTGTLDIRRGNLAFNGGAINTDRFIITNSPGTITFNGGQLTTRSLAVTNVRDLILGQNAGFGPAVLDLRSNATASAVSLGLTIGHAAANSALLITNGGRLTVGTAAFIGYDTTAANSRAQISGAGSFLETTTALGLGVYSSGNSLTISGGGMVSNAGYMTVGDQFDSQNNTVLVTGPSSILHSALALVVGNQGSGNSLIISNGARVNAAAYASLGEETTADNNRLIVSGAGSALSVGDEFDIGFQGANNTVLVTNGATVTSLGPAFLGGSNNFNQFVINGAGSAWTNALDFYIGAAGTGNVLVVSGGGVMHNGGFVSMGDQAGAANNGALITGAGSIWNIGGELDIGYAGSGNTVVVSNGATLLAGGPVYLGGLSDSLNNHLAVVNATLMASNTNGTAALDVRRGSVQFNGGTINVDRFIVEGTNADFNFKGGTLLSRGGYVANGHDMTLGVSGGSTAVWDVGLGSRSILLRDFGPASPYPSVASVSGLTGTITNITVTLSNLSHTWPDDLDILLVGPGGQASILMSDCGGDKSLSYVTLSFDDRVSQNVPGDSRIDPGTYDPTDKEAADVWPAPVPPGVLFGSRLSVFNGTAPNGVWSLYINDDGAVDAGELESWSLFIETSTGQSAYVPNSGAGTFILGGLVVGQEVSNNQLLITNGGSLVVSSNIVVGANSGSLNNRVTVTDGALRATNVGANASFDLRRGTNILAGGTLETDRLLLQNNSGRFQFSGGTLSSRASTVSNGQAFVVGHNIDSARLHLAGSGNHLFSQGLLISTNARLTGSGTVIGAVTNRGTIAVGNMFGGLHFRGGLQLTLSSVLAFDIGGILASNQYDTISGTNVLQLLGGLSLRIADGFAPAPDNTFTLLNFNSIAGTFTNAILFGNRIETSDGLGTFTITYLASSVIVGAYLSNFGDVDGDHVDNYQELLGGTDPYNPLEGLIITRIWIDEVGRTVVEFQAQPGRAPSYRMEYSTDLQNWNTVPGALPLSFIQPNIAQWLDDGSTTGGLPGKRFYRIKVLP